MATINIIPAQPAARQFQLVQEDISDQLGNSTVVFFTSQVFLDKTLQVFLNGLSLRLDSDFSEISNQSFRFINYNTDLIRVINSTNTTLAVKYFVEASTTTTTSGPSGGPEEEYSGSTTYLYVDDLTSQIFPGITTFYFANSFEPNTLVVFSDEKLLEKNVDYTENGTDSIIIASTSVIQNNNLVAKYIIT